jgi:hypothetical protein
LTSASDVKLLDSTDTEIPGHVSSLGPWRTIPPTPLLCSGLSTPLEPGIRSVLIQFTYTFTSTDQVPITVEIGSPRTQDIAQQTPVRDTWRRVNDGTYAPDKCVDLALTAANECEIDEPAVYALLPPHWLACSNLTTIASVSGDHDFIDKHDQAQIDFFDTVINNFNPNPDPASLTDFYEDAFPWLYDRAQTFYNGYIRTGRLEFLREAHRASQHYMKMVYAPEDCADHSVCLGYFIINPDVSTLYKDSKYSYNENLATLYWLTGDPEPLPRLSDITDATKANVPLTQPIQFGGEGNWMTERHWANAILAPLFQYEITGDSALAAYVTEGVDRLYENQQNPFPPGSSNPVNGCFNHDWEQTGVIGISPWKMSLLAHALLRVYHTLGDPRIPKMLSDAGRCLVTWGIHFSPSWNYYVVREEASSNGTPAHLDGDEWTDMEHNIDNAYTAALAAMFSPTETQRDEMLGWTQALLDGVQGTPTDGPQDFMIGWWTRPLGYPENGAALYWVTPPRKYSWWFKNSGAIGWAVGSPTIMPGEAPDPSGSGPCDLNTDGVTNVTDVQISVNQALGDATCDTADLDFNGLCNIVDVQRLVNTALGSACVAGN